LNHSLNRGAVCFLASWGEKSVAFSAWLPFVGKGSPARREHRTVTLPDYQGVGIGNALSSAIAGMWKGLGYRATSTTTHPAMIQSRLRSPLWRLTRQPALGQRERKKVSLKHAVLRMTAGFRYVGPAMTREEALRLLDG
jgi:GNAT superfamily N-acetyltransferase